TELIAKYGYPVEEHHVVTPDGYILTLHRIPHGKNSNTVSDKVVFLQHGLLCSSADWVLTGVTHGLDTDSEFWQFSWHEIGAIDLPAMIDYVLEITGQTSLYHAGHSQGTTTFYVMASMRPEYNAKIKAHFSLAPIAYMNHMTSPLLQIIAYFTGPLDVLMSLIGINEFLPSNEFMAMIGDVLCKDGDITQILCTNALFILCGFSPDEMNATILPVLMGHTPAGASVKQLLHYGQEIVSGAFRQYDFGLDNSNHYGQSWPPNYDLAAITAPIYLLYSHNDWMASEQDVIRLCEGLGDSCRGKFLISDDAFNHLDYLFGIRAPELPEIITKYKYPVEVHHVTTNDSYILTLHRIPNYKKSNKGSVLVMHGILASSADWIITGPEKGLGYALANEGYDVWLGNARGNRYSRNHTTLNPDSSEFWNFSWHEIGLYDVPAMVDYIITTTGQNKIFHVGHSQGTTAFYVMCSMKPEYNKKIRAHFSMAPVAFVSHMISPFMQMLAKINFLVQNIAELIGLNEFMPRDGLISQLGQKMCGVNIITEALCSNTLFTICGFNPKQLNTTILPLILAHVPAGSSSKQFIHFAQEVNSGNFRQYDYGFFSNWKRYNSWTPPSYDLTKIEVPLYFFYSDNDWISSAWDVHKLAKKLKSVRGKFLISDSGFDHMDYLFGIDASRFPELIRKYGYPCEEYHVTTSDGYILTLHRIPHGRHSDKVSSKVVFVQHGLISSSADFIITGVDHGLGYILADEGYDVWMGNARGNKLSRNHTTLDPNTSSEFWQFSWHQIGIIDLPTMIDFVLEKTGQTDLYYVGHSQGTTSFYVMASMLPEYNAKIKAQFSLAPIAFMNHMTSPLMHIIAFWTGPLDVLTSLIGLNEFLPSTEFMAMAGALFCGDDDVTQALCTNGLFIVCGFSPSEMNATLLPVISGHTPAGASIKQIIHYGQEIVSGHFRQFDFGLANLDIYGSLVPPDYDLSAITAPVYLLYSHNDWLAGEVDVVKLCEKLGNCAEKFLISEDTFNHLDFVVGIRAPELVYNKLISLMAKH
ncbi:Abhydro lipase domain containing protein, partial [Asbolus verrucosus]